MNILPAVSRLMLSAGLLLSWSLSPAWAETYPARPVTLVVPSNAGSSSDQFARIVSQTIGKEAGVGGVVENKPGANGIIGVQSVLNAAPDGYSVLVTTISPIIFNKYLYKSIPYDSQKDLVPVAIYARSAMLLGANPQLQSKDLASLVDFARANPAKLNLGYATATQQLAGEMFQLKSGTKLTFVHYRTNAAMLTALITGEVDLAISDPAGFLPFLKTGQVRLIAATSTKRMPSFPEIPTFAEKDVDLTLETWNGMFTRKGTSPEVNATLSRLLHSSLQTAEAQNYLKANSYDNFFVTGDAAAQRVERDLTTWKTLTEAAGVTPQ